MQEIGAEAIVEEDRGSRTEKFKALRGATAVRRSRHHQADVPATAPHDEAATGLDLVEQLGERPARLGRGDSHLSSVFELTSEDLRAANRVEVAQNSASSSQGQGGPEPRPLAVGAGRVEAGPMELAWEGDEEDDAESL